MDRIVSDMLFLAQASHASPALKLEQLSLGSEARRVCEYFEVLAEEAGVATTVTGDAMILGNRLMVQRAISNLLSNALRHSNTDSRSEEHTSELQSLMRISYAVFCLKKKK